MTGARRAAVYDVPAPAKLNLFLHVVGRRADGYHLLQSVFSLIDWCDTLHLERRSDGRLARHDLGEPLPADDLCLRAARALQQASGTALGVDISIDKRIPSGAGLGGGSSDAASVLLALNRLWRLEWPTERLLAIALTLGADVPFFVNGRNAWVEGIGERLQAVDLAPRWYAVAKPPSSIATSTLFANSSVVRNTVAVMMESFGGVGQTDRQTEGQAGAQGLNLGFDAAVDAGWGRNDLQGAAEGLQPAVGQAAEWLRSAYGRSRMTGSGSAVYAIAGWVGENRVREHGVERADSAAVTATGAAVGAVVQTAVPALPLDPPAGCTVRMCRGLLRHPLLAW